ncbi:EMBRYO DEFECTIVE 140 [Citrus sinensis]|nr:EMBRYO DEFECTIVE 140 [Citrus sinensis]
MTSIPRPLLLVLQEKEKQVLRIRSIFHRQLSVPLANSSATLLAYKSWELKQGAVLDVESSNVDGISSNVAAAYQKALEMCNARAHVEEQISRQDLSDSEKFQQYMADDFTIIYLKYEQSSGDPGRVQLLYERAITDFPVSSDLWLDYTRYLDKTLKVYPSIFYFTSSVAAICILIDSPLQVDGLRWRILFSGEVEGALDYSLITETLQRASDYLSEQMKNNNGLLRLYAYWARLEQTMGKDTVSARSVWERLLKISGTMLEAWQSYISVEIELGHINEARSIDKRCYSKRFTRTGSEISVSVNVLSSLIPMHI